MLTQNQQTNQLKQSQTTTHTSLIPSTLIEILLCIIKSLIFFTISKYTGYVIAGVIMYLSVKITTKILERIFKLKLLRAPDRVFLGTSEDQKMSLCGNMHLSNFNIEKLKNKLRNAMKKNSKIGSRLIYFLWNYWWEEIPFTEARFNELVTVVEGVRSFDEVIDLQRAQINDHLDLSKQGFKCVIYPFTKFKDNSDNKSENNEGGVSIKIDHSFSDGLGITSLTYVLADNVDFDMFPKSMKSKQSQLNQSVISSIIETTKLIIYYMIDFLLLGWFKLILLFLKKRHSTIMNNNISGQTTVAKPLKMNLDHMKTLSKKHNLTINEFIIALVSMTFNKLDPKAKQLTVGIPIGNTRPSLTIEKLPLRNLISGLVFTLPLINNISESSKTVKELRGLLSSKLLTDFVAIFGSLINQFIPTSVYVKYTMRMTQDKVDLSLSNTPGPSKQLVYDDMKMLTMVPINSTGPNRIFFLVFSYTDHIYVTPMVDKAQNLDPELIKNTFSEIYEYLSKGN